MERRNINADDANWRTTVCSFGKYKDETIYMIYLNNPEYIVWACSEVSTALKQRPVEKLAFNDALRHIQEHKPEVIDRYIHRGM